MSTKHASSEWHRTTRTVKAQVKRARERGDDVVCWRHGHLIAETEPYDVGHIDPHGGESIENAAPECRRGNRSHGGKLGAQITNGRKAAAKGRAVFRPLPWKMPNA